MEENCSEMAVRKQSDKGRLGDKDTVFWVKSPITHFQLTALHSYKVESIDEYRTLRCNHLSNRKFLVIPVRCCRKNSGKTGEFVEHLLVARIIVGFLCCGS